MRLTEEEQEKLTDYLPYTDKERFRCWAAENGIATAYPLIDAAADSYFEDDRGAAFGAIEEYTLSNIENIGRETCRIIEGADLAGGSVIEKITTAAMLKAKPLETSIRERYHCLSQQAWSNTPPPPENAPKNNENKVGAEPPTLYYPM
jgi:hypothetical protein